MGQPVPSGVGAATSPPGGFVPPPKKSTRRGTELVLLVFVAAMVTGAFVLVSANQQQKLSMDIVYYGLAFLAQFTVAHLAVRKWAPYADPLILPCVALLNGLGLVMIHRIDLAKSERYATNFKVWTALAPKQVTWTTIALAMFIVVLALVKDHRMLARYGFTCGFAGFVALVLPAVLPNFLAPTINGAKIWLRLGFFSIQPGEFAKILLMIFFAAFLVSKRDLFTAAGRRVLGMDLPRARDLGPILATWAVSVGILALEKDLGMSVLFFGIVLVMIYVATERAAWVVIGLVLFAGSSVLAYKLFSHVQVRVSAWSDPFADANDTGYQMVQSLFSLGTGGVGGTGLGAGRPDMVPLAWSDFIISAIGEELGFIGLASLLVVYLMLSMRGLRSALAVRDTFGKLLAGGLAFSLALQVFVIVGGVTKLIPMTGVTTPFLSQGGSSLLANYILVALLLRISDAARRPQPTSRPKPQQAPIAEAHTILVEQPS